MDIATVVSILLIAAACVFFVLHTAKGTGMFSPDGEAAIGVIGGFGLFIVVLAMLIL